MEAGLMTGNEVGLHGIAETEAAELLARLESMRQTQIGVFAIAALALLVAAVALTLAVGR